MEVQRKKEEKERKGKERKEREKEGQKYDGRKAKTRATTIHRQYVFQPLSTTTPILPGNPECDLVDKVNKTKLHHCALGCAKKEDCG